MRHADCATPKRVSLLGVRTRSRIRRVAVVEDVVCGMEVRPGPDAIQSTYEDKTYYFCAPGCKRMFDKNPAEFAAQAGVAEN
jgi:YHS domain-containing protein